MKHSIATALNQAFTLISELDRLLPLVKATGDYEQIDCFLLARRYTLAGIDQLADYDRLVRKGKTSDATYIDSNLAALLGLVHSDDETHHEDDTNPG